MNSIVVCFLKTGGSPLHLFGLGTDWILYTKQANYFTALYIQAALEPVYFGVYRIDKFIQRTKNEPIQRTK